MQYRSGYTVNNLLGGDPGNPGSPDRWTRPMTPEDAAAVTTLWDESYQEATGEPFAAEDRARVHHVLLQYPVHQDTVAFVAGAGSQFIGFVVAYLMRHPVMEGMIGQVEELFVTPEWRRKGVASDLVRHLTAELQHRGAWGLRSSVVVDDAGARAFWKAQGWSMDLVNFTAHG